MTGIRVGISLEIWWSNEEKLKDCMVLIFVTIHEDLKTGVMNPHLFPVKLKHCQYIHKFIVPPHSINATLEL